MRKLVAVATVVIGSIVATGLVGACGNKDQTPNAAAPTATAPGQYPPGYPQQYPQGQYPQQPQGYPQQPQQYPQQQPGMPGPAPTAPAAAATMATPSPIATPCQNDGPCLTHHCNLQYQKCAFPCQNSEVDCVAPNVCNAGVCGPKLTP